ncbi:MAG: diguanylate cyclase [Deltaproteobacteria bacterium]|nr:diguanylate cyclase [Deltaproteobacteria bacterium]
MESDKGRKAPVARGSLKRLRAEGPLRQRREASRHAADELAVIAEIGRVISSTLDIDEVYERFAAEVRKLIPFDHLAVSLNDPKTKRVTITYALGPELAGRRKGEGLPLAGSLNERLIETRAGQIIDKESCEALVAEYPTLADSYRAGYRSYIFAPLVARDEMIGALNFRSRIPHQYNENHLRLATRIGEQIAGAIAAAQLFAALKKTEQSLRESERRFRPLFEQAAVGVAEVDIRTGRFLTINRRHCELLGMTEEEALSTTVPEISHPEDRHLHEEKMALLVAGKLRNYVLEKRYIRKDGAVIWVTVSASSLWKEGEKPERVIAVVEDITERKRAEEVLRLNQEIASRLAKEMGIIAEIGRVVSSSLEVDEVYERLAVEVRKLIPFDRLGIALCNGSESTVKIAYAFGMSIAGRNRGDRFPLAGTLNELLMFSRTGLLVNPQNIEDLAAQFPTLVENYRAGVRSFLSVPLIARDEAIGVLDFRSKKPNAYTEEDLSLARRIGEQIAGAIAGAQLFADLRMTEKSLRESEARFRILFDRAEVGVAETEIETSRFLTVNRRYCEILGMTEEELLATTSLKVTHPEDRHLHEDKMALLVAGKIRSYTLEKRYIRKDGVIIWVSITVSPLSKAGQPPTRTIVVTEDITESKRIREENETRAGQLAALHQTSMELTAELNLDTLLHSLVQRALTLIGGTACHCYLYQAESQLLERAASAGTPLFAGKATRQLGKGFVGQVWAKGVPLVVNDYRSWEGRSREYDAMPSRALVGAPIRWGDEFLGVLDIMAPPTHRYAQGDVEMLDMFATQAAIAIRNARLYNQIEQIAVTDELTGLFNRRGFFHLGEREFERALRFKRSLAVLMFDIDHFKQVNDTYGHGVGDQVLRELADCFRQNIRGIDVAGRYGGEEFVLILPETQLPKAVQIAERLRRSIANLSVLSSPANGNAPSVVLKITVSIGISVLQPNDPNLKTLVDRADHAQYQAKHAGRNRVAIWGESE